MSSYIYITGAVFDVRDVCLITIISNAGSDGRQIFMIIYFRAGTPSRLIQEFLKIEYSNLDSARAEAARIHEKMNIVEKAIATEKKEAVRRSKRRRVVVSSEEDEEEESD